MAHEVAFGHPRTIHTDIAEAEALARELPGALVLYHCGTRGETCLPIVGDGTTYEIGQRGFSSILCPSGSRT